MISALRKDERIIAPLAHRVTVRKYSGAGELQCPVCGQQVIFYAGDQKIWHFAHSPGASECSTSEDPDYRPETQEHQAAKTLIYAWLTAKFPSCEVGVEVYIPATNQFADVLLRTSRATTAFELQYSPLTGEEWRRRSALYSSAGIADVWLLIGRNYRLPIEQDGASEVTVHLSGLAKAILRKRGLVNFLDINSIVEGLKTPQYMSATMDPALAEEASLVSVNGIGDHYDVDATSLEEYLAELNARSLADQHPWFSRLSPKGHNPTLIHPWSEKDIPGRTCGLQSGYVYQAPLKNVDVDSVHHSNPSEAQQQRPILLASPRQAGAVREAWAWEKANHQWHKNHPERLRRIEVRKTRMARDRKILVGQRVAATLPTLYPALLELANYGREQLSERALRSHPAIPKPVRKWPAKNWTPLTNIEVPLEWVFGCHRQVWQMVVYCCCFYRNYSEEYLARHDISASVSNDVFIGYALKALANELPEEWWRCKPVDSALQRVKDQNPVGAISSISNLAGVSIHSLRYIVMSLYFDRLCDFKFLKGWSYARETKDLALQIRRVLFTLGTQTVDYRKLSSAQLLVLGEKWTGLTEWLHQCEKDLRIASYELTSPFIYPCAVTQENNLVKNALNRGTLRIKREGIFDGAEPILAFDWKRGASRLRSHTSSRRSRAADSKSAARQTANASSDKGRNASAIEDHRVQLPMLQPVPAYRDLPKHTLRKGMALSIESAKCLLRRYGYRQTQVDGTHGTFVHFENMLTVTSWGYFCSLVFDDDRLRSVHVEDDSSTYFSQRAFVLFAATKEAEVVQTPSNSRSDKSSGPSQLRGEQTGDTRPAS